MIEPSKLRELVQLMVANDLTELDLRDDKQTVTLKRAGQVVVQASPAHMVMPPMPAVSAPAAAPAAAAPAAAPAADPGLEYVVSPMVGTCYLASSPDAAPFVKVGDPVSSGQVTCLIEAMKVFNEIKSDKSGKIVQVLVKNGEAVEFGQRIFAVRA
ncbi:MAG: acetyl-CoA carboxylase biotin carboxyl carrier protein [Phycisphaerales bacterium]|nr:acetyl-CoA carboxylase biotin carboxyl carrier protein [Phycisphaerales bacterium]